MLHQGKGCKYKVNEYLEVDTLNLQKRLYLTRNKESQRFHNAVLTIPI